MVELEIVPLLNKNIHKLEIEKFIWNTLYSRREGGNDTCWRRSGFCFKHRGAPLNIVLVEKHDLLHVDDDKETLEFLT